MMLKQIQIFLFACLFGGNGFSQLTTNTFLTPTQLVENILVGRGIDVFNVKYSGASEAIGQFNATTSNVGINQGLILSTGNVLDHTVNGKKNGPVGPNNTGSATTAWNTSGDASLTSIIGNVTHDAVVLEFDFIPQGDTIRFNYVFASEEYIEFVGSADINDVFAFFISGPGFPTSKNIAVLPGTNTPVSINNVNNVTNNAFYINNGDGFSGPQSIDPTVVNFDGITVKLTAIAKVTPCKVYHLRLVLADGGDASLDSGVFLQAGSLNSNPAFEYANIPSFNPLSVDTLILEGCTKGKIKFKRFDKVWNPFLLDFRVLGTAKKGVDYNISANQVSFPANVDEVTIDINSIADNLNEGTESVILRFPSPFICIPDSIDIIYNIIDKDPLVTNTIFGNITCPGDDFNMKAVVSGGVPGYTYSWSDGKLTSTNKIYPVATDTYFYTVTDICGTTKVDSAIISVPNFQPLSVNLPNDTVVYCPGIEFNATADVFGGGGIYSYLWNTGYNTKTIKNTIIKNEVYSVTVSDNCGNSVSDAVSVNLDYVNFSVIGSNDTTICFGDKAMLSSIAKGGIKPYDYIWETGSLTNLTNYYGTISKFVGVSVMDSCGIIPAKDSVFVTIQKPIAKFDVIAPISEILETIYFKNSSIGIALNYDWDFGNSVVSILEDDQTFYLRDSTYAIKLMIEDDLGCKDSLVKQIKISPPLYYYLPNSFTPNGDGVNEKFVGKGLGIERFKISIFDKWGIEIFSSIDYTINWEGRYKSGKYVPMGVYVYKVFIKGESGKEYEKIGKVTLIR